MLDVAGGVVAKGEAACRKLLLEVIGKDATDGKSEARRTSEDHRAEPLPLTDVHLLPVEFLEDQLAVMIELTALRGGHKASAFAQEEDDLVVTLQFADDAAYPRLGHVQLDCSLGHGTFFAHRAKDLEMM